MRPIAACIFFIAVVMSSCDDRRLFEDYVDFDERFWVASQKPEFEFDIQDPQQTYSLYCNLRNAEGYPFSDFRFTYYLTDSSGTVLEKKLMTEYLFDKKSGKPFGESGLGDIYDHQFLLLKDYKFSKQGKYRVRLEQFMRADTLKDILGAGIRVERSEKK
jgi:gliding motility-associated lipoprotein GldH